MHDPTRQTCRPLLISSLRDHTSSTRKRRVDLLRRVEIQRGRDLGLIRVWKVDQSCHILIVAAIELSTGIETLFHELSTRGHDRHLLQTLPLRRQISIVWPQAICDIVVCCRIAVDDEYHVNVALVLDERQKRHSLSVVTAIVAIDGRQVLDRPGD